MKKSVVACAITLFASACCTSLPRLAPKRTGVLASPSASHGVEESSAVWHDERRSRDVPVHIYAPTGVPARWPVVIFSHGIGEDRDSYRYLGRALASNGFLAVHVTHAGTDKATLKRGYWKLYQATKQTENWRNRPLDVTFVIDRLSARPDVDRMRIAVAGHSAGAFTAFAVAGVTGGTGESLRDDRVRAIVPMSMPRIEGLSYDAIRIPVLNITGTCDSSIIYRTRPQQRRIPFEQTHASQQHLVTIDRANHNTFSNATDPQHDLIVRLMIGFLRGFLFDDRSVRSWFDETGEAAVGSDRLTLERK